MDPDPASVEGLEKSKPPKVLVRSEGRKAVVGVAGPQVPSGVAPVDTSAPQPLDAIQPVEASVAVEAVADCAIDMVVSEIENRI